MNRNRNFLILFLEFPVRERCDRTIQQILFVRQICSLHEVIIDMPFGLTLYKGLGANRFLQNIDLVLETIDDLYILLDGLIPNIQKMIIQLRQSRILCKYISFLFFGKVLS